MDTIPDVVDQPVSETPLPKKVIPGQAFRGNRGGRNYSGGRGSKDTPWWSGRGTGGRGRSRGGGHSRYSEHYYEQIFDGGVSNGSSGTQQRGRKESGPPREMHGGRRGSGRGHSRGGGRYNNQHHAYRGGRGRGGRGALGHQAQSQASS